MAKILVVEDEDALRQSEKDWLESESYLVDATGDGETALEYMLSYHYDVIVLDLDLPGISGIELCRRYRSSGGTSSVIMLTGQRQIEDKEKGLDSGADDYLTKPVQLRELSARIRASLRRASRNFNTDELEAGSIKLNTTTRRTMKNGIEFHLNPTEFALLEFFMRNPDKVFTAEAIIERAWPTETETSADMVRRYVSRLRSKIDERGHDSMIRTIHGIGYRFDSN